MASRFAAHLLRRRLPRCSFSTAAASASASSFLSNPHQSIISRFPSQPFPPSLTLRFLSTRSLRPTGGKKPDIGARARQHQTRRLWNYSLTFGGIAGFIVIVLYQFQDQLVFYITPSEAIAKYNSDPSKAKFRLGGLVLENSVAEIPSSPQIQFVITDLLTDILVKYEGSLPDLFREGHSVVVEGYVRPFKEEAKKMEEASLTSNKLGVMEKARSLDCYFWATEVLAKHDEKYMPAEVAAAIDKNRKLIAAENKDKKKEASVSATSAAKGAHEK